MKLSMKLKKFKILNFKTITYKDKVFVVIFWVTFAFVIIKLILNIFIYSEDLFNILYSLFLGILVLATQILVLEKSRNTSRQN